MNSKQTNKKHELSKMFLFVLWWDTNNLSKWYLKSRAQRQSVFRRTIKGASVNDRSHTHFLTTNHLFKACFLHHLCWYLHIFGYYALSVFFVQKSAKAYLHSLKMNSLWRNNDWCVPLCSTAIHLSPPYPFKRLSLCPFSPFPSPVLLPPSLISLNFACFLHAFCLILLLCLIPQLPPSTLSPFTSFSPPSSHLLLSPLIKFDLFCFSKMC